MPRPRNNSDRYLEQAIIQLLSLKIQAGGSVSALREFSQKCIDQAIRTSKRSTAHRGLDIHRLGSVLRTWHKETQYLTFDGLPRPLKKEGQSSLKTLVKTHYPEKKFRVVFERLRESNLIKRHGDAEWVPSGRTARISQATLETLEHLSEGIARYVATVTRNVSAKREQDVLFERSCKVTALPVSEINAFREYVGQQALAFIVSIDDWLEGRSTDTAAPKTQRYTAGVYTFAYAAANRKTSRAIRATASS
jgi:hypothetical protein